uniref:Uncharacterized protein n=1 Tax=Tanacetum cinerariifolium TaxID=118510 RepID=A0A6L2N136_TANCI|nr:hypothetical protein [Tanacetum cinerariifolium]
MKIEILLEPTSNKLLVDEAYARELEAELNKNIDWDEVRDHVQRKQKEDNAVKRYQALKWRPSTEAQARKNMMIYLRNVNGFKMDYFKGMTYDDIRLIFEKHFDSDVAFLQKTKEQMDEEDSGALKRLNESQEDKAAKKQKLDEEVEELKRRLQIVLNDEDDVYTEATPLARKIYKLKSGKIKEVFMVKQRQELEAVRVLWCADYHIHYNTVDFAGRKEIFAYKTTTSRRIPARVMFEYILHLAQDQEKDQAS